MVWSQMLVHFFFSDVFPFLILLEGKGKKVLVSNIQSFPFLGELNNRGCVSDMLRLRVL